MKEEKIDGYYATCNHDSLNRLTDLYEGDATLLAHYERDAFYEHLLMKMKKMG